MKKNFIKIFSCIAAVFVGLFAFSKCVNADSCYAGDGYQLTRILDGVSLSGESAKYYCFRYYKDSNDEPIYSYRFLIDTYENSFTMYFGCTFTTGYFGTASLIDTNVLFNMFSLSLDGSGETYCVVDYYFSVPITQDGYFYIKLDSSESTNDLSISRLIPSNIADGATYADGYSTGYDEGYSVWQNAYDELNSSYTSLQQLYDTLNSSYTSLTDTYNALVSNYDSLQEQYDDLASGEYSFSTFFWSISAVPFGVLGSMLNFEILGVNMFGLVTGILTAFIIIWLVKKFILK